MKKKEGKEGIDGGGQREGEEVGVEKQRANGRLATHYSLQYQ